METVNQESPKFEMFNIESKEHSYFPIFQKMYHEYHAFISDIWKKAGTNYTDFSEEEIDILTSFWCSPEDSGERVCVLMRGKEEIGFIHYSATAENGVLTIENVYVREQYRLQGAFNFMYEGMLSIAKEHKYKHLELGATVGTPAIALYKKLGMRETYIKFNLELS